MAGYVTTALFSRPPYRLLRWGLSILFIYSGAVKLGSPGAFAAVISDFGLVHEGAALPVAISLSSLEALSGLGLLVDLRGTLSVITGLILLFAGVLSYGIWLGLDIDCGCFGLGDPGAARGSLSGALGLDMLLLVVCTYLYGSRRVRGEEPVAPGQAVAWIREKRRK